MTITEFLEARITEDEAAARECLEPKNLVPYSDDRIPAIKPEEWGDLVDNYLGGPMGKHCARHDPTRVLADCAAKRAILAELKPPALPEWTPDCGGDWCLSSGNSEGPGITFFANYWPDHTVSASIYADGHAVHKSGIVARQNKIECQSFAERWIIDHLSVANPTFRALAAVYASHPDYRREWVL